MDESAWVQLIRTIMKQELSPIHQRMDELVIEIKDVRSDISLLHTTVSGLQMDITSLRSDVADLQADFAAMRSDVADLQADFAAVRSDVADLQAGFAAVRSDVADLQAGFAAVRSDVADLQAGFAAMRSDVADLQVGFAAVRSDVADLQVGFAAVRSDVADLQNDVHAIRTELADLQASAATKAELSAVKEELVVLRQDFNHFALNMEERLQTFKDGMLDATRKMLTEFSTTILEQVQLLRREHSELFVQQKHLAEMFGEHELDIRLLKQRMDLASM
ncbi:MAG: hypothetical protein K6T31_00225 [Alicyclobacillus sp.]|nr:hypothetical protein [Alicyclobacillus sp.]